MMPFFLGQGNLPLQDALLALLIQVLHDRLLLLQNVVQSVQLDTNVDLVRLLYKLSILQFELLPIVVFLRDQPVLDLEDLVGVSDVLGPLHRRLVPPLVLHEVLLVSFVCVSELFAPG